MSVHYISCTTGEASKTWQTMAHDHNAGTTLILKGCQTRPKVMGIVASRSGQQNRKVVLIFRYALYFFLGCLSIFFSHLLTHFTRCLSVYVTPYTSDVGEVPAMTKVEACCNAVD